MFWSAECQVLSVQMELTWQCWRMSWRRPHLQIRSILHPCEQGAPDDLPLSSVSVLVILLVVSPALTSGSQGFDRGDGGFGRNYDPNWSLVKTKATFNDIQVNIEKEGGWNSN